MIKYRCLLTFASFTFFLFIVNASLAVNKYVELGTSVDDINGIIASAQVDDLVIFRAGTHVIDSPLELKSDITIRGDWSSNGETILDASASVNPIKITNGIDSNNNRVVLINLQLLALTFKNIQLEFIGDSTHGKCKNIIVNNCEFIGLKNTGNDSTHYILFSYGADNEVTNSRFMRLEQARFGRGITLFKAHSVEVSECVIYGYFTTGVLIDGVNATSAGEVGHDKYRSKDIVITDNTFHRIASPDEELGTPGLDEDHGIYAAHFKNLTISENTISGWSPTADGGCVKIRNAEDCVIDSNIFIGSGIMMYTYDAVPHYLKDIDVINNVFSLPVWTGIVDNNLYRGVSYYRSDPNGTESSIRIQNNILPQGVIYIRGRFGVVDDAFDANGGGVIQNILSSWQAFIVPANVHKSGNNLDH